MGGACLRIALGQQGHLEHLKPPLRRRENIIRVERGIRVKEIKKHKCIGKIL
jgi:hypothetical protein